MGRLQQHLQHLNLAHRSTSVQNLYTRENPRVQLSQRWRLRIRTCCTRWPTRLDTRTRRTSTTTTTNTGWTSFPIWQMTMDTTLAGQKKAKLVISAIESYGIVDGGSTPTNVVTAGEQL